MSVRPLSDLLRRGVVLPVAVLGALTLLAGCTLGPDYRRPVIPVPAQWRGADRAPPQIADDTADHRSLARQSWDLVPWWQHLNDPLLDRIVEAVLVGNRDIALASEKVVQARGVFGQAASRQWPEMSAKGAATRMRQPDMAGASQGAGDRNAGSGVQSGPFGGGPSSLLQTGLDANWELDLFGANRRTAEAARYGLDAVRWQRRAVRLAMVGDAVGYFTHARLAQHRHAIEQRNVQTLTVLLHLARTRLAAGAAPRLEAIRFEADLHAARMRVSAQAVSYRQAEHALSLLTADAPGRWLSLLDDVGADVDGAERIDAANPGKAAELAMPTWASTSTLGSGSASTSTSTLASTPTSAPTSTSTSAPPSLPVPPPLVEVAVPAVVLLQRPDLQVAERRYAQATAQLGVAQAERLPRVSLVGSLYSLGTTGSDLGRRSSLGWSLGPSIAVPLFTGGRLRAAVANAASLRQQAFLTYEAAVLTALRDVEDAMVGLSGAAAQAAAASTAAERYGEASRLASARYAAGADQPDLALQAARDDATARAALADARAAQILAYVALQKALGGAWDTPHSDDARSASGDDA